MFIPEWLLKLQIHKQSFLEKTLLRDLCTKHPVFAVCIFSKHYLSVASYKRCIDGSKPQILNCKSNLSNLPQIKSGKFRAPKRYNEK